MSTTDAASTCRLNVHRFVAATRAEGPGTRSCVWLQGCSRHCPGCFATATWSHAPRLTMTPADIIGQALAAPHVEGITVLGGEPFEQPQALACLLAAAHRHHLSTLVFTGYTHEELTAARQADIAMALAHTDVLVDGPYRQEQRDFGRPLVGSANQRFLFFSSRYSMSDFAPNRVEVRISPDGTIGLNGMGPMETLIAHLRQQ